MNVRFLIDRLVRHQAVLLAELATNGGARAPLSELMDQTFMHLAEELDRRGVGRKVSADMFGMALRAYQKKIQRLAESSTEKGTSLWEAVLRHVSDRGEARRADLLQRFVRDDEAQVRAVLFDLVESGIFLCEGQGPDTMFRVAPLGTARLASHDTFVDLLWLIIFREGPVARDELVRRSGHRGSELDTALMELEKSGRISKVKLGEQVTYSSNDYVRPIGNESGWEAAVLDHVSAMVSTVRAVLSRQAGRMESDELAGGFTYALDIWPGHPMEEEVSETLNRLRAELSSLRERVDKTNAASGRPAAYKEVTVYGGQSSKERTPK
jgi:hypothetical protein